MVSKTFLRSIQNEIKDNLSLSIPLIAAQLIYACSGFIGTALVARLGEDALAASVLVSTIWMSLSVLFFGLLNSVSVLVSHQYGAKNKTAISEIMGQSFILGILVTILIIALLLTMPIFLRWTTQPPTVIQLSIQYMHSLLWTIPGLIILIIYEQFLAGINLARMVLRISLLVVPIEIPIIYLLIFGKFGLPYCGVAGIGYGFAITYTMTAIFMTIYFLKSRYFHDFGIFKNINKLHFGYLKDLIGVGLPMGFMHLIEVSTFTIATFWVARFGTTLLAAHQIVFQYLGFAITFVFAMAQAVTVRVGHEVGRLDLSKIYGAVYVGMIISLLVMICIAIAFYLIPGFFLSLDIDVSKPQNQQLVKDGAHLLFIGGILMLFDNCRIIGFGALRGLKDTKFPMYSSIFSFWIVGLGFALLFGFYYQLKAAGIWWGLTIGIFSGAIILIMRIHYLLKRVDLNTVLKKSHESVH